MTRKMWAAFACVLILAVAVSGFLPSGNPYDTRNFTYDLVAHIAPPDAVKRAEAYSELIRRQNLVGLQRETRSDQLTPQFDDAVKQASALYPRAALTAMAPVQYTRFVMTGGIRTATVVVLQTYANGSIALATVVTDLNSNKIQGFNLRVLSAADIKSLNVDPLHVTTTQAAFLVIALLIFCSPW